MKDEIVKLIEQTQDLKELKELLDDFQPYDIAAAFAELDEEEKTKLLSIYENIELAEILSFTDEEDSADILEELPATQAAAIINEMELDDAADILEEMEEDVASKVSELLPLDTRTDLEELSTYDEDTAGALMNPNFVHISLGTNVKNAYKELILQAGEIESIDTIFILDEEEHLKGIVDLKKLICARMPLTVDDIMTEHFAYALTTDDHDTIVKIVKDYDTKSLPVLEDGVMKGIITMDDAFDTLTEEAEEDYAKLAGLTEDEEDDETIIGSVKKRIPWLAVLLVLDVFIAIVISKFNAVIEKLTILTFFQAAVLGLAGNCGTQSLAISVRKIADGDIDEKGAIAKHVGHEVLQGIGTGLLLGISSFILVVAILYIKKDLSINPVQIGLVLGISICVAVILANITGSILPVFFYKIHIDPAVASGPFITTLNDIVAVITYFGVALLLLSSYM